MNLLTRVRALGALVAFAMLACAPATAHAGSYTVLSCKDRSGNPAPIADAAGGWHFVSGPQPSSALRGIDYCPDGGPMLADIGGPYDLPGGPHSAEWNFDAPANTVISAFSLSWDGYAQRTSMGKAGYAAIYGKTGYYEGDYGGAGDIGLHSTRASGLEESVLVVSARCLSGAAHCGNSPPGTDATVRLRTSEVVLRDDSAPNVGVVSGNAASAEPWRGVQSLTLNASDTGSGVYRAIVKIDGDVLQSQTINANGGRCVDGGGRTFLYPRPCLLSASGDVAIDTTKLPEGNHSVRVLVEDAAGNQATAFGPVTRTIDNVPPPTNLQTPAISGFAQTGEQLTLTTGAWDAHGAAAPTFGFQWQRCAADGTACTDIAGENTAAHTLVGADNGHRLTAIVTATNSEGATAASASVTPIIRDQNGNQAAPAPAQTPSVAGTLRVGATLTGQPGSWSGVGNTYAYRWERCRATGCETVPGATGTSYTLQAADEAATMRFIVTATNGVGSTTAMSGSTAPVQAAESRSGDATPSEARLPAGSGSGSNGSSVGNAVPESARTADRGAANGDNAADRATLTAFFAASRNTSLSTAYGKRAVIRGKLVDASGAGIRNAKIELVATNVSPGSTTVDKGGARTRNDGTWTLILPADVASRTLTFRYRSHLADERPVSEVDLHLAVRAGLTMKVTPRHTHNRGTIRFSGRLLGKPVPQRGKVIELQARTRGAGRWLTFKTLRTSPTGTFHAKYTFHATYGSVTYEFRARAREESSYPFLTGVSHRTTVKVR